MTLSTIISLSAKMSFSSILGLTDFKARANFRYHFLTLHAVTACWTLESTMVKVFTPLKCANSKNTMLSLIFSETFKKYYIYKQDQDDIFLRKENQKLKQIFSKLVNIKPKLKNVMEVLERFCSLKQEQK